MSDDKTLDLVRTLLAIADGGSPYPEERARARERAERLMLRHSIDEATAAMSAEAASEPVSAEFEVGGSYVLDQIGLIGAVYDAFGCRTVRSREVATGRVRVHAYGFAHDMALASTLADALVPQMLAEMHAHGGSTSTKKSFAASFAGTVARRLREFYAQALVEAEAQGTGSSLVLADRDERVDATVARAHPGLRTARRRPVGDLGGWLAGDAAGRRADITVSGRRVGDGSPIGIGR
ncbi:DUF2786 domain-containing protein [Cellulomonas sp. PhB143]|uniref:DUF7168 domain-containing protein n=1 Tax=Cellulomonas sp. PhB143 TaxID=2485186 RepID=UPI000F902819|nr:DUF2786 domain-containing protein [Cellulomonas sp. PhB143]ROS73607.1 uncharacterized protein DUF2786 [Cellulomonas sp. PhB143]